MRELGDRDGSAGRTVPPLAARLEGLAPGCEREEILAAFLDYTASIGIDPYPAQEDAILDVLDWKHVILKTPTGSGKSLVALSLHFQAMAERRVSYYTAPTKALVNEKFFALCDAFGPERVGLLTGDAAVNRDAPIVCCTAEVLANMSLREDDLPVDYVVMDEFHFYGDRERGAAWQIPLLTMTGTVFLLMSATLGDTIEVERLLAEITDREVSVVWSDTRPVPLEFDYRETPIHETIASLLEVGEAPIYLVSFTQRGCAEQAQSLTSVEVCTREERREIAAEIAKERFDTPYGGELRRFLGCGIGVHHAGLLPRYRRIVERLSQSGLVKVICGTDTLGVGVNIPIRTVVLKQLYKYDGEKTALLTARAFHQIAGRAGRKGFDDLGRVVVQAPEWTIENRRIEEKIAKSPHLRKKLPRKRPPPGAVSWDRKSFERLVAAPPEALEPQLEVTHGMIVNLLQSAPAGPGGGYGRLVEIIARSRGSVAIRRRRRARAAALFRSLRLAGIVEVMRRPDRPGADVRVRSDLQRDFSLNHTLSLYLVQTVEILEPDPETWALDVLSLVEAILEDPRVVLMRQVDRIKGELVARLKAEGVEYSERMDRLAEVEHPKPCAELIEETFEAFRQTHPWVGEEDIRPKSVAREMYERCVGFDEYVRELKLARSEGSLLRYLSQVYKTAVQNVPEALWTEEIEDVLAFLHGLVRRTDSSLVEEWELLVAGPSARPAVPGVEAPERARSIADDPRAFASRVRNELHVLLKALADGDYEGACALVRRTDESEWTPERFEEALAPYLAEHASIDMTPRARQARNTFLRREGPARWIARQKIVDPEGDEDWMLDCVVDLEGADEGGPLIELARIGV